MERIEQLDRIAQIETNKIISVETQRAFGKKSETMFTADLWKRSEGWEVCVQIATKNSVLLYKECFSFSDKGSAKMSEKALKIECEKLFEDNRFQEDSLWYFIIDNDTLQVVN